MKVPKTTSNYEPLPAGNYVARLYQIIYIGTIPVEWNGVQKKQFKVRLGFEFPTEKRIFNEEQGEQPYVLSTEMTYSTHPKSKLRAILDSWNGKKLTDMEAVNTDLDEYIGKEAMVNVVHKEYNDNVYASISAITPLPKGVKCPKAINPTKILDYGDNWDEKFFQSLPEFLRKKIESSAEYQMKDGVSANSKEDKDNIDLSDIPF